MHNSPRHEPVLSSLPGDLRRRRTLLKYLLGAGGMASMPFLADATRAQSLSPGSVPTQVALAGIAYAGSEATIAARFPHTRRYVQAMQDAGTPVYQKIATGLKEMPAGALQIVDQIDELKGRDQALAVALVIGAETVVVEQLGAMHKLLVLIRGQAMFFDFKSMNVVRAYPLSFAYVDLFDRPPSDQEVASRVRMVYEGAGGKPGILTRFTRTVAQASIPATVPRFIQVTSAQISPEALQLLPEFIRSQPGSSETWLADIVAEAISTRMGVPIVPYSKGYAVGNVMSMRVSDGKVWELKLPQPDYEIGIELTGLKKIKFNEVAGGATSFIYGSYVNLRIEDALKKGMNTAVKNGETRVIPASQTYVDDFPHYYDAINGLFTKMATSMSNPTGSVSGLTPEAAAQWLKTAASAKDIGQQIERVRSMLLLSR